MVIFAYKFLKFTVIDLIDVAVVALIFYKFLALLRGTRAAQMITGLTILFVVSFFAFWFQLSGLMWLFSNLATVGFIVLVILFQPEIRGALAQIGYSRILKYFYRGGDSATIDEISKAVLRLSVLQHGALIVMERNVGLKDFVQSGKEINSKVSAELITTIFTPYTPLHDGAIIIRSDLVIAAGCMLPLSQNPAYLKMFGMRHKAAVGITEESDAVCIVVSEETGAISLALEGALRLDIERTQFKEIFSRFLQA
jgi:diadenylate cyclase